MANLMVALGNFFELGCPSGTRALAFGSSELTPAQSEVAQRFLKDAEGFCAGSGGHVDATGRGRSRLLELIPGLGSGYGTGPQTVKQIKTVTIAQGVEVDKISVPAKAGLLRTADMMAPERAKVFKDLRSIILPSEDVPRVAIKACHKIDAEEELRFVQLLLDRNMGVLICEDDIDRHPVSQQLLRGGVFAVPHKPGKLRLIYDRRAQNELEKCLADEWLWLPHGSQYCDMLLDKRQGVRGCADDLSCWFYQLAHERDWWRRQAVGRRIPGSRFTHLGTESGKNYRLCLRVVAMGDTNGVPFAQEAHEFMLRAADLLGDRQVLRFGKTVPHATKVG